MFVTYDAPAPPDKKQDEGLGQGKHGVYLTPLWLFCSGAAGSDTEVNAIAGAWGKFTGTKVKTHESLDPNRPDPSVNMNYYKNWLVDNETAYQLLASKDNAGEKDAKCQSWVDLFRHVLLDGGVAQSKFSRVGIQTQFAGLGIMLINDWTFAQQGTSNVAGFPYLNKLTQASELSTLGPSNFIRTNPANGRWEFFWGPNPDATDADGAKGQNVSNPRSFFSSHFIMRIGDTLYDPSYGRQFSAPAGPDGSAILAACVAWEQGSLAAFGKAITDKGADGKDYVDKFVFAKNTPDRDLQFIPVPW